MSLSTQDEVISLWVYSKCMKNSKLKTKTAIDYIEKFNQSCEGINMNGLVILITF